MHFSDVFNVQFKVKNTTQEIMEVKPLNRFALIEKVFQVTFFSSKFDTNIWESKEKNHNSF